MAVSNGVGGLQQQFSQYKPDNLAEIIDKLAGDKDNLRIDVQSVKFCLRNARYEVNGKVNFNVLHKNSNAHAKPSER
jgi:hypothetical protein